MDIPLTFTRRTKVRAGRFQATSTLVVEGDESSAKATIVFKLLDALSSSSLFEKLPIGSGLSRAE